jgi:hypothetical protein
MSSKTKKPMLRGEIPYTLACNSEGSQPWKVLTRDMVWGFASKEARMRWLSQQGRR